MKAKEVAAKPLAINQNTLATTARNLLYKTKKRTAFVIEDKKNLTGAITLKTIMSLASLRSNLTAKDIADRPAPMVDEEETLESVAKKMVQRGAKEIAVVRNNELTGVIDTTSMMPLGSIPSMKIKDMGLKKAEAVENKTPLPKIIGKLKKHATLAVTKDGKLEGVITRTEVAIRRYQARDLNSSTTAEKMMNTPAISVDANGDIADAARIMIAKNIHALPVVEKGKPVGIITRLDILKEMTGWK